MIPQSCHALLRPRDRRSQNLAVAVTRDCGNDGPVSTPPTSPARTVVFVLYDDFQLIELAGPIDVLAMVNNVLNKPFYRLVTVSPQGRPVRAAGGIQVTADDSLHALADRDDPIDTMIVVGGFGAFAPATSAEVPRALPKIARRARRVTSVCAGALLLAAAGLLDGYRATTHWGSCDLLAQRYPRVTVEPDRIYVHDRNRWTSAGGTAGIDLALALVEEDCGAEVAQLIARFFVVFTRRPGGQAQFSAQLRAQPARTPAIRAIQQWLPDNLHHDLGVSMLARRAGMSDRTFARTFRTETGCTPAAFVEHLRVEAARRLLETSDLTIDAIARAVGYRHGETLHRVISRHLATTPNTYRQHFAVTAQH